MRLLHKKTLDLEFFLSEAVPPYLILSHRWQGAETSLQEFLAHRHLPATQQSAGTAKALRFCAEVADRDEQYVWVDTCCIDKTSSAELQEAINSMYKWYERAHLCYVLLDDVLTIDPYHNGSSIKDHEHNEERSGARDEEGKGTFEQSRWFTRGWTLQELLAPGDQIFVNAEWSFLGSRDELGPRIEAITGIRQACFGSDFEIRTTPVAKRMSWLSGRKTSRAEDLAYCMLGIFNVNMTMLYGEGTKAFARLQREIVHTINDESIFLWRMPGNVEGMPGRILAPTPHCFAICRSLDIKISKFFDREPYRMTTRGLEIELYGRRYEPFTKDLSVVLNCTVNGKRARIPIQRVHALPEDPNDWHRLLETSISTLNHFDAPPSAWKDFNTESDRLRVEADRRRGFGAHGNIDRTIFYRDEVIRFKVYIG